MEAVSKNIETFVVFVVIFLVGSDWSNLMQNTEIAIGGAWRVTDTVISTRKNLFCLSQQNEHHIGTIVSGSQRNLDRFEQSLVLIRTAPDMFDCLKRLEEHFRISDQTPSAELLSAVSEVVSRASSKFKEG